MFGKIHAAGIKRCYPFCADIKTINPNGSKCLGHAFSPPSALRNPRDLQFTLEHPDIGCQVTSAKKLTLLGREWPACVSKPLAGGLG